MGQTITIWRSRVSNLVRDGGNITDLSTTQIDEVGIKPALAQYAVDRPREIIVEVAGAASSYFDLPTGWVAGFSRLLGVEHPARQNPPSRLDEQSFSIVRKTTDVTVEQILLDVTPSASEYVRLRFTASWPTPTGTAGDDKVDDIAFNAVTALAASLCCVHLAAEAARSRMGALPVNFADGRERARLLTDTAKTYRGIYDSFLGFSTGGDQSSGSGTAPASTRFDYDPAYLSMFHGRRR